MTDLADETVDHPGVLSLDAEESEWPGLLLDAGLSAGTIRIDPEVLALSFAEGLWDEVNRQAGTSLDNYEEETLSPAQAERCATALESIVAQRYPSDDGTISRTVAWIPHPHRSFRIDEPEETGQPVVVEMPLRDWRARLLAVAAFLRGAGRSGVGVHAAL